MSDRDQVYESRQGTERQVVGEGREESPLNIPLIAKKAKEFCDALVSEGFSPEAATYLCGQMLPKLITFGG